MPLPRRKTEAELREHEIADAVRGEVNRLVAMYRRRALEVIPELIDEQRDLVNHGTLRKVDPIAIQDRVHAFLSRKELEAGDDGTA